MIEAFNLYSEALSQKPNHATARHNLGVVMMERGDYDRALPHLTKALNSDPGQSEYWFSLCRGLIAVRRFEDARKLTTQAAKNGFGIEVLNQLTELIDQRVKGVQTKNADASERQALVEVATAYTSQKYSEVLSLIDGMPVSHQSAYDVVNVKGASLFALGRYRDAVSCYSAATGFINSPELFNNWAPLCSRLMI